MNANIHHTKSTYRTPKEPRKGCRPILVKTTLQAGVLSFLLALSAQLPGYAQQIESYDSGAYSDIFRTTPRLSSHLRTARDSTEPVAFSRSMSSTALTISRGGRLICLLLTRPSR